MEMKIGTEKRASGDSQTAGIAIERQVANTCLMNLLLWNICEEILHSVTSAHKVW
jgi:hypothetical protein